jgi:dephospho-CoA kinase
VILGITGGTGSGKTTLLEVAGELGFQILDCDAIYHQLLQTDCELLQEIEKNFPGVVENGQLMRKKLGAQVFADEAALERLNRITHGAVKTEVLRLLSVHEGHAAIDAIGLFEGELAQLCDCTVAVLAPREDRVRRLIVRDGITREYAEKRLSAQHPDEWFRERCDCTLENDGELDAFATKCVAFLRRFSIIE